MGSGPFVIQRRRRVFFAFDLVSRVSKKGRKREESASMPPPMNCRLMCSQWFAERNKGIFSTHALAMFFNPSLGGKKPCSRRRTIKRGLDLSYQGPSSLWHLSRN